VCTSIIESGLDIPRANTLVVERADAFGLAQLYQIRGRVGRSDRQAYAYLVVPPQSAMTDEARERVEALCRHTDLGSGFAVATLDMEIRGAGNLLGPEQSGSVAAVGFDMYCDLLAEATAALRGEERADEIEPEMSIDRPGLIPESYMPDVGQRLQYYKRLASAADEGEIEATAAEMLDRFGPLPEEAEEVIEGMRAKHLCRALGIVGLECSDRRATLHLGTASRVDPDVVLRLVREGRGRVRVAEDYRISVRFAPGEPGGVEGAIRFLRALVSYDNNPSIL